MPDHVLVTYYSRSGHTKEAAEQVAERLRADIERIEAPDREPKGVIGFLSAGMSSWRGKAWPIRPIRSRLADYDIVVICAPVWAGRLPPPVRQWLQQAHGQIKVLAGLATVGGTKAPRFFRDIETIASLPLQAQAMITDADRKSGAGNRIIDGFVAALAHRTQPAASPARVHCDDHEPGSLRPERS